MRFLSLLALMAIPLGALASTGQLKLLFLGNSHTAVNNLPEMVKSLARTSSQPIDFTYEVMGAGHLEDMARTGMVFEKIRTGKFNVVVLQAAMVSMSHENDYSQEGAVAIAKAAVASGARVLMYPEWSRRDIEETEYTERIYRSIASVVKGKTAPVGRVWDEVLRHQRLELWSPDGNHASLSGSFLAANVLYRWLVEDGKVVTTYRPEGVSRGEADLFQAVTVEVYRKMKLVEGP